MSDTNYKLIITMSYNKTWYSEMICASWPWLLNMTWLCYVLTMAYLDYYNHGFVRLVNITGLFDPNITWLWSKKKVPWPWLLTTIVNHGWPAEHWDTFPLRLPMVAGARRPPGASGGQRELKVAWKVSQGRKETPEATEAMREVAPVNQLTNGYLTS